MSLISWKRESGLAARTRIHDGFGSLCALARGTILMIFCWPFCFTPASRTEVPHDVVGHALADLRRRARDAQIARLRDLQAAVPGGPGLPKCAVGVSLKPRYRRGRWRKRGRGPYRR